MLADEMLGRRRRRRPGRLGGGRSAARRGSRPRPGRRPPNATDDRGLKPWALSCRSTAARRSPTPTGIKRVAQRIVDTRKAGQRRRRGRLRHGRHHRRAARPRRAGDAAAAAARARHAAHRRRADLDGAGGDGDRPARPQGAVVHRLAGRRDHRLGARQGQDHRHHARPDRERASQDGAIAIVAGFQGVSQDTKDITTLGRGASDTTAVALAAALGAEVCEIYSDVDGVFTADPRIVPTARKLDRVSTEEMLEMAASRRQDPAPAVRRVRPPLRHAGPRALLLLPEGGHLDHPRPAARR